MKYDVPLLTQSVSPICYVVAAAMVQKYWQPDFDTTNLTGGWDPNNSCIPGAKVQGLYTQRLRRAGFAMIDKPATPFDAAAIDRQLRQFGPLVLNHFVANFNYGSGRGGKQRADATGIHAVVVTGIEGNRSFFNNPWGDKDVEIPSSDLTASIAQSYAHPYNALFYANASPLEQNILD